LARAIDPVGWQVTAQRRTVGVVVEQVDHLVGRQRLVHAVGEREWLRRPSGGQRKRRAGEGVLCTAETRQTGDR
jgi:hypothetical protein